MLLFDCRDLVLVLPQQILHLLVLLLFSRLVGTAEIVNCTLQLHYLGLTFHECFLHLLGLPDKRLFEDKVGLILVVLLIIRLLHLLGRLLDLVQLLAQGIHVCLVNSAALLLVKG